VAGVTTTSSIHDVARDAHRWIALETMLFEALGAAARSAATPVAARRLLATWRNRHAWHVQLWRDRVPDVPHHRFPEDDDDLSWLATTRAAIESSLGALVDPVLVGVRGHVAEHRARVAALLDGPTARVLDLVAADVEAEIADLRPVLPADG
jgi:hypothetical protein